MGSVTRLRLLLGLGLAVCALTSASGAAQASTPIAVHVRNATPGTVEFRFSGFRECDSVVSNANVLAWLGPWVKVVVQRGATQVAWSRWEACTKPSGSYLPWEVRPRLGGQWLPVGTRNVFRLKAEMRAPGRYRYTYTATVDGRTLKKGRIEAVAAASGTPRVRLT